MCVCVFACDPLFVGVGERVSDRERVSESERESSRVIPSLRVPERECVHVYE